MRYGYITNGLADHRLDDALAMLADCGYDGVGLTLDHHHLDPFAPDLASRVTHVADRLRDLDLDIVIETGGRFVLDPVRKHEPTLLSDDGRERRIDFLDIAVRVANDLGAPVVSFWSGRKSSEVSDEVAWKRLVDGCAHVLKTASQFDVDLAFEPEPGMFLQYIDEWERLGAALHNSRFGITLDLGHCHAIEDESVAECIRRVAPSLKQVQIEDMKRDVHEHLDFGDGTMEFPPIMAALNEVEYSGLVCVELSRHSHTAHTVVPRAIEFLKEAEKA